MRCGGSGGWHCGSVIDVPRCGTRLTQDGRRDSATHAATRGHRGLCSAAFVRYNTHARARPASEERETTDVGETSR
jgi:hypothetical protein